MEHISPFIQIIGLFLTIYASVWSLAWWLSGKFSQTHKLIFEQIEKVEKKITEKMEYHEKHDDQRFNALSNDLWEIKMRNAAIRGLFLNTEDEHLPHINKKLKKMLKET